MIVVLYVDDLLIAFKQKSLFDSLAAHLKSRFDVTESSGDCFIGLQVVRDRKKRTIKLHQRDYAVNALKRFGMENCTPVNSPADKNVILSKQLDVGSSGSQSDEDSDISFRALIGVLMFLMICTRPDIAYIIGKLSQFLDNPSPAHMEAAKRVLRYLKGTLDIGIVLGNAEKDKLVAYGDADFAACIDSRKSTSGVVLVFGCGPVIWSSRKQTTVATSTCDAEFIAAHDAAKELTWARGLLKDLKCEQVAPTKLMCDNMGAKLLIENPVFHRRTKHVDIKYRFTREKLKDGTLVVHKIGTEDQLADIFTKALAADKFKRMRVALNIV